ncbi:MAG: TVP38/TMEM64 family protein [Plesiomonas sp.]|uniref:TVP38/TMEM64 family protein n=1 Tax=Plesiomonas sp. TaxID=2486279 RepID=UPI003F375884
MYRKLGLGALLIMLISLYFIFGLQHILTLEHLKESYTNLLHWRNTAPLQAWLVTFTLYITVAMLSLPGATIMTLATGALFGLAQGVLLVSFASSIGATLAFWVARYCLKESVEQHFPARLQIINAGLTKEGLLYLLTLRLIPLFPFFLVNILMGLTQIRSRTYYWVSQLGMLPAALIYVNAGTQLSQIRYLTDILSPTVFSSLLLIGIFPVFIKKCINLHTKSTNK